MNILSRLVFRALILLAVGCGHSDADSRAAVALGAYEVVAGSPERADSITGPLLLDRESFSGLSTQEVAELGSRVNDVRLIPEQDAIRCSNRPDQCVVNDNGLFVSISQLAEFDSTVVATVRTINSTKPPEERSASGTCTRVFRFTLHRERQTWRRSPPDFIRTC